MIHWPCILQLDGDDELTYLASEDELARECAGLILTPEDRVIDSAGFVYTIVGDAAGFKLVSSHVQLGTVEVTALVQSHEFCRAEVCLTKIQFGSVADAINGLKSTAV